VLPVALMQIAVTYVFFDAHWQTVTARLSEGLAGDIAWAVESYKEDPAPRASPASQRAEESMSLSIALQPAASCRCPPRPAGAAEAFFAPSTGR
jgi:two-component system osmolarity sensor histidine kinase EnvZ